MKILCILDSFGSGGAQRQMVELVRGLTARGHSVEMFVYFPQYDFFRSDIDVLGITVHEYRKGRGFSFGVLKALIAVQRRKKYDVVLSFLTTPNVYAELASLFVASRPLIISERSSHLGDGSWLGATLKRFLHLRASRIVTNSHAHAQWLRNKPWLRKRVVAIYNGIGLDKFRHSIIVPGSSQDIRLIAVGRVGPEKNVLKLIEGLALYFDTYGYVPRLSWVGRRDESPSGIAYCEEVDRLLAQHPQISKRWEWLGERSDVPELLAKHHALIHPSIYEGLPNVVCEALVSGRSVVASNVCDHPLLVEDGKRGFLFDPEDPQSIADAVYKLGKLSKTQWSDFSHNARDYAETNLGTERMIDEYEGLLKQTLKAD